MYMIQKILAALMVVVFTAMVASAGPPPAAPENLRVKPAHIVRLENLTMSMFGVDIEIVDWMDDDNTLWLFVDNKSMDGSCDYVAVYGIINRARDEYELLAKYTEKDSADPCELGRYAHKEYLKTTAEIVKQHQLKRGI